MKVLIIGAGAAGLMAANTLTKSKVDVILLEAENRIGGRIHTFVPDGFTIPVEAGAEFIHGSLPLTLKLMRQARLQTAKAGGKRYRFDKGRFSSRFGSGAAWERFYEVLEGVGEDGTLSALLAQHFGTKDCEKLREEVIEMAQGLDLADADALSVKSIRGEWLSEATQFRPVGSYSNLLDFIHKDCALEQLQLHLETAVKRIVWENGKVCAHTNQGHFTADAVMITASVGSLQQHRIGFEPAIPAAEAAFGHIGFGQVIKFAMEFSQPFWEAKKPDMGFLFTRNGMTFWTQLSLQSPVLTGWIGNQYVPDYAGSTDAELIHLALSHLTETFGTTATTCFRAAKVFRYDEASRSAGGYSWRKPQSADAIAGLNEGVEKTIWFAGEALHPGNEVGTVEAALQSGLAVAQKILKR